MDGDRSTCLPQSKAEAMSAAERKLFVRRGKGIGVVAHDARKLPTS